MNFRLYVEKKEKFRVEAQNLLNDLKENTEIKNLENIRILNIYDIFNINKEELEKTKTTVFSEINVDKVYSNLDEVFEAENKELEKRSFAVEFLPGQYDQRADSAEQCISLLIENNRDLSVRSGKFIILYGNISDDDLKRIKKYYINEVEMREKNINILVEQKEETNKDKVPIYE